MNPTLLALSRLQQPTPPLAMPGHTGPTGQPPSDPAITNTDQANQQMASQIASQTDSQSDTPSQTGSVDYQQLAKQGYSPTQIEGYLSDNPGIQLKNAPSDWDASIVQPTIIPKEAPLTETFGEIQPGVEVFSHGVTTGTGIGVKAGTPLATPPGEWKVVSTYDRAPQKGYIGNGAGDGWGNNIVMQNTKTGEELRYSHLSDVQVAPGDRVNGTRVIGLSGQSGNTTGDHLNLQYITPQGQPGDVLQSQYAKYLPIKQ